MVWLCLNLITEHNYLFSLPQQVCLKIKASVAGSWLTDGCSCTDVQRKSFFQLLCSFSSSVSLSEVNSLFFFPLYSVPLCRNKLHTTPHHGRMTTGLQVIKGLRSIKSFLTSFKPHVLECQSDFSTDKDMISLWLDDGGPGVCWVILHKASHHRFSWQWRVVGLQSHKKQLVLVSHDGRKQDKESTESCCVWLCSGTVVLLSI